jgi:ribonuclease P protein component
MHATKDQIKQISVLKKRADFLYLNKSGKRWVSQGLVIQATPKEQDATGQDDIKIRFGITVTKKTYKSAVKRNRIKRRLRAVAQEVLPEYARENCDYVLIGRELTLSRPYETLKKDLIWCLNKMEFTKF